MYIMPLDCVYVYENGGISKGCHLGGYAALRNVHVRHDSGPPFLDTETTTYSVDKWICELWLM